ncbi:GATA transcription factor 25-like isoform X3 [Tripterygium wilfordii]|uniref:GATA transcription factor 25-like isoform X3 n=1 Tax=Tripterygium wilfordii TaxID=458696 RepID=UPI0018F7F4F3|nr:GATA transcription factor 25-like isoform X3 [Tripterygium wilfordii]
MYGHSQSPPMSIHRQISADEDDGSGAPDSIENHHIRYDTHPLDGSTDGDVPLEGVTPESVYVSDGGAGSELAIHRNDDTSQLTLSFRGQVYVFDAVTAEKVQAVLLLLGGCELSSGPHGADGTSQNQRAAIDFPARCSQPQRAASLNRFRQKRKERCFDKKVRYGVRQEVALSVIRVNLLLPRSQMELQAGALLKILDKMITHKKHWDFEGYFEEGSRSFFDSNCSVLLRYTVTASSCSILLASERMRQMS